MSERARSHAVPAAAHSLSGRAACAATASLARAGRDRHPVLCMIEWRWFSTVRWLMRKSAAMFLLGAPVSTRVMISHWRGVR